MTLNAEAARLEDDRTGDAEWRRWGPWLSERQWGTVREDYSADGSAWDSFPHDHARSRAYRWGEDGIGGFCDANQLCCLSVAMWNGNDPILKERLFGLTNAEGNHGEDVKEEYAFLDATPTASFMKMTYKYPHAAFPYEKLLEINAIRDQSQREYELLDTGVFDNAQYFDVTVEYAKASPDDILMRVTATNRAEEAAVLHLLPQCTFRNTWSWEEGATKPVMRAIDGGVSLDHPDLGTYRLLEASGVRTLFCENETNTKRLYNGDNASAYPKDAFHAAVVDQRAEATNPARTGTRAAFHATHNVQAGESVVLRLRLVPEASTASFDDFDAIFQTRQQEADAFHDAHTNSDATPDERSVARQARAGMVWACQYYNYSVARWLEGDPTQPAAPTSRLTARNCGWKHLNCHDVVSMPDTWEYPWFAAWDTTFHAVTFASFDPEFAKRQVKLLLQDRTMHPSGEVPAYEWAFGDVNPPLNAWAAWRVFQIDKRQTGRPDHEFLRHVFHRLLLTFSWWVNRKDANGANIFDGGFLGLDNIGAFDRSQPLPPGYRLQQADATSWVAMFALRMMRIALELALKDPVYQDLANKFFLHFLSIAHAMNTTHLWNEEDSFFFDVLVPPNGPPQPMRIFSAVGLIPMLAVETIEPELMERLPAFRAQVERTLDQNPDLASLISRWHEPGRGDRRLLSLLRGHRMKCLLARAFDEKQFLSPYGIRSVSQEHRAHPFEMDFAGQHLRVDYEPGESNTGLFGGNSNWRGPVWFPINFLLLESMHRFHHYYGDDFKIEAPTGSGREGSILEAADLLRNRLTSLFMVDANGDRPVFGSNTLLNTDEHFKDRIPFHEYFDGETGRGCGASHQTGWTGLIGRLLNPERLYDT